jgi:hypothetical protein
MLQHALGSRMGGGEGLQWQTTVQQVSKQINIKHINDRFLLIPLFHFGDHYNTNHITRKVQRTHFLVLSLGSDINF